MDQPLGEKGRQQGSLLKQAPTPPPFDLICCSDLIRSLETDRIIASPEEETIQVLAYLREINRGVWDGLERWLK
jgi:broad specificity phosphatase PhoE